MKKLFFTTFFLFSIILFIPNVSSAQDLLYFCEKYTSAGEVGVSDRFTTGTLTIMVKLNNPIYYEKVFIQWDKYNCRKDEFEFYKKEEFTVNPDWTYIHFDDIEFLDPGFFRVFLLDPKGNTITSSLIEIISR